MSREWTGRVVIYDHHETGDRDGVVVDPRCPTCRRVCSGKKTSVVYDGWMEGAKRFNGWRCKRCGPFQPEVMCWAGDLR